MKTFEVEVRRTSYITVTVQAKDAEQAETRAWVEVGMREDFDNADWQLESIEEMKGE
jgi:hypothetical protein